MSEQEEVLTNLKEVLSSKNVIAYFNEEYQTELVVYDRPVGLGAMPCQTKNEYCDPKVVAYASPALTSVERLYSKTEREAISIVRGREHYYFYGSDYKLISGHKLLELIFNNSNSKPIVDGC